MDEKTEMLGDSDRLELQALEEGMSRIRMEMVDALRLRYALLDQEAVAMQHRRQVVFDRIRLEYEIAQEDRIIGGRIFRAPK